ncbi:MAG: helix-turn-helix transcriptional regulator [Bacteroidales bacterium]|nr:helix-turn-helix transcriptional regulator [Bacteroidales bacterium]
MIDRIKKIMEEEGMPYGKFAEEIGINGSRLSHYISGRNNVSLDLVTRILERFRGINSEWLLFGRGEMYKSAEAKGTYREPDLFSPQPVKQEKPLIANEADKSSNFIPDTEFSEPEQLITAENTNKIPLQSFESQPIEPIKNTSKNHREIEKIIVMYTDSTFDSYLPNGHRI